MILLTEVKHLWLGYKTTDQGTQRVVYKGPYQSIL
jgi:hypothetical protein